jgi:LPXTG-motif cell wall-anchored protein
MKLWDDAVGIFQNNYTWFFSGLGIFLLAGFLALFKRKNSSGQNQIVRNGSAIQAGRDVKIKTDQEKKND